MKEYRLNLLVCAGTGCVAGNSFQVKEELEKEIAVQGLKNEIQVVTTGCQGFCERGPILIVQPDGIFYQRMTKEDVPHLVQEHLLKGRPVKRLMYTPSPEEAPIPRMMDIGFFKYQRLIALSNRGRLDPENIEEYIGFNGYSALEKALTGMTPEDIVDEVKRAGLRGRGGAGFPTGQKWQLCRRSPGNQKYVICNGDEGDPGAFMDRSILEADPHAVIEGMIIGARAIGAGKGFIYVRSEYPLAVKRVKIALQQAEEYGLLGEDIFGTGFNFFIDVVQGAGAFVCGEETALIASIEGKVGRPKQRPPYPAVKGLWGKPTNINNVETWANVPKIILRGADWFSSIGTETSKGTKIFSLVGKINNTGLVEVPMGITLKEIIYGIGGGIPKGKKFKAVQTGGPSGGCIPGEMLDLPIDYESLARAGSIMGSGGMIVMDEDTCMVDIAKYFLNFLRGESCGKCLSCREGTQRMWEIVNDITEGKGKEGDLELLEELAHAVKSSSMCGLGQTAANPVFSTLKYFRHEYEAHIKEKKCPAGVCKEIVYPPCQYTCPIDQEASVYIALIAQGKFDQAFDIIRKDNPLPVVCGRVCPHPCESRCKAGEMGEPISIRALKRFVFDRAIEKGRQKPGEEIKTKEDKVAIIGAGPAGLTAGYYLNREGYKVTIFESLPVAGGMLAGWIPGHRLPKKLLNVDIQYILDSGVQLETDKRLGKDFSIDDLFNRGYKAVFIAIGAHRSMRLNIPGEETEGVLQAMELLKAVNLQENIKVGKRVGVIGGGNAAVDAARVAIRNKDVEAVTILYRRTRNEMPAFKEEVDMAVEEGVDVRFLTAPVKVLARDGKVEGVECMRMKLGEIDDSGRRRPIPVEGSEFVVELDTLVVAIGEKPDKSFFTEKDNLNFTQWDTIAVDEKTLLTGRGGVFAGGDIVTGPRTVIEAIAAGKRAAQSIAEFLEGKSLSIEYGIIKPSMYVEPVELSEEEIEGAARPGMPLLSIKDRKKNFNEVELGLSEEMAIKEARRCLRCDLETAEGKKAMEVKNGQIHN
jgi:NADH-quinone oxidoreductase subunit F